MNSRCACLLSICVLSFQSALCLILPRHNIANSFPLKLSARRSPQNCGGIALAITRELALHRAWDSKALSKLESRKKEAATFALDEVIEFYIKQHDIISRELLLPSLVHTDVGTKHKLETSKKDPFEWDIAISTEQQPLQCAVLATVPPGTVMVRPKLELEDGDSCYYISVKALNSLVRMQPTCLEMIFPNVGPLKLEKLYGHSSMMTCIASCIGCRPEFRRLLSLSLMALFGATSHWLILDLIFFILRLKLLWHPQVYSIWSRIYHTPAPMMLITAKKGVETLLLILSCIDDYIRDCSHEMEGDLLNSDIKHAVTNRHVVEDSKGRQKYYETCFNPVRS